MDILFCDMNARADMSRSVARIRRLRVILAGTLRRQRRVTVALTRRWKVLVASQGRPALDGASACSMFNEIAGERSFSNFTWRTCYFVLMLAASSAAGT